MTGTTQFFIEAFNGRDPFRDLKTEFANYDGNLASFLGGKVVEGLSAWIDDVRSGVRHRCIAGIAKAYGFVSVSHATVGVAAESYILGASNTIPKTAIAGGRAGFNYAGKINVFSYLAYQKYGSVPMLGREAAPWTVQINHFFGKVWKGAWRISPIPSNWHQIGWRQSLMHMLGTKALKSKDFASMIGREMQHQHMLLGYEGAGLTTGKTLMVSLLQSEQDSLRLEFGPRTR